MNLPQAYIDYLVHFHGDRDYFECHEILEEYWKEVDNRNKNSYWVGLIQLAVSNYHHRRSNFNGAYRTCQKSIHILSLYPNELKELGLDTKLLFKKLNERLLQIKNKQSYQSMDLPLISKELISQCMDRCQNLGFQWTSKSNLNNLELVHRHKKRDRTDVINERKKALQKKQIEDSEF